MAWRYCRHRHNELRAMRIFRFTYRDHVVTHQASLRELNDWRVEVDGDLGCTLFAGALEDCIEAIDGVVDEIEAAAEDRGAPHDVADTAAPAGSSANEPSPEPGGPDSAA